MNRAVQERLSKWPKEGIDAYRARYEAEAKAMLDATKSDDVAKLHREVAGIVDSIAAQHTPGGHSR